MKLGKLGAAVTLLVPAGGSGMPPYPLTGSDPLAVRSRATRTDLPGVQLARAVGAGLICGRRSWLAWHDAGCGQRGESGGCARRHRQHQLQ